MEILSLNNVSFIYSGSTENALSDVSITIKRGDLITVCGRSGCGKSTLLRMLKPSVLPSGTGSGSVLFNGSDIDKLSQREESTSIGFVMQDPESQIVTDKVWHELSFGLESLGMRSAEIRARIAEISAFFGIDDWFYKKTDELSGGQKQILNLAAVMIMRPDVLLLDEPTSRLDPIAAQAFFKTLEKIRQELGTTIIIVEHRLEDVIPLSDRVIVMDEGQIAFDGEPKIIGKLLYDHPMFSALPTPIRVFYETGGKTDPPISVREGRIWLAGSSVNEVKYAEPEAMGSEPAITARELWFRYKKELPDTVKGLSLSVNKGEIYALLGGNGVGKSTLLSILGGLRKPYRGRLKKSGTAAVLPQDPRALFSEKTVEAELKNITKDADAIADVAEQFDISELLDRHPYDLSGGELERSALARLMLIKPDILLLDEPTKGMDAPFKAVFADILLSLKHKGITIVIVSHDMDFCAEYADRCGMMFDGQIVSEAAPRAFFDNMGFYTTAANRMAKGMIPRAILDKDIIAALGSVPRNINNTYTDKKSDNKNEETKKSGTIGSACSSKPKTGLASLLTSLAAAILTVLFGIYFLGDRKYYFISLLIIIETLIPFAIAFEKRKPGSRELVIVSVLCAIVVAGRSAFFMVPQFKPTLALVIICGVALGGETGFVIGAASAFVSNIFFGQGPWTPWQMFALGTIGLLSGAIFSRNKGSRLTVAIFGAVSALIYGGIMNPAAVLMTQPTPDLNMILSAYALGAPFDIINGVSTVLFLILLYRPMLDKLERVRLRYGLI